MPKMKTHRGAKKRFKITGTGKVLRMKGYRGHNKSKKNRRQLFAMGDMHEVRGRAFQKKVRAALPYGD